MNGKDTIFALSSGSGSAGIAVIRLSGPESQYVLERLAGRPPTPRQASLRTLRNPDVIDEAMVLWFPAPKSATGEDVAELHVHGSAAIVERLLSDLATFKNCRPALPGEFTRRAFENERMDLVEVEGLADLLQAESEAQRRVAMRQFSGEASSLYAQWHEELLSCLAIIEACIDFADEDGVAEAAIIQVRPRLETFIASLRGALSESEKAARVRRGLRIVIAGAPNVGKSSLLNALVGRKAAIVSEVAGTTRDVVQSSLVIEGLPVSISDTAGLRSETQDDVEREGMERSRSEMSDADILIWVKSAVQDSPALPMRHPDLTVINKVDLQSIQKRNDSEIAVSVKTGEGIETLRRMLAELVKQKTETGESAVMVRIRHVQAVTESIRFLNDALVKPVDALELMAEDVRKAAHCMATITGRVGVEDFLGKIFQDFCIGK
jgi:tRNA modification GTPase